MILHIRYVILALLVVGILALPASAKNRRRPNVQRLIQQRQQQMQSEQKIAQEQAAEAERRRQLELTRRRQSYEAKKELQKEQRDASRKLRGEAAKTKPPR